MAVYEIETESGAVYEIETEDGSSDYQNAQEDYLMKTQPITQLISGAGRGALEGLGSAAGGLYDTATNLMQGKAPWADSEGEEAIKSALDYAFGDFGQEDPISRVAERTTELPTSYADMMLMGGAVRKAPSIVGKIGRLLSDAPATQVALGGIGGLASGVGRETDFVDPNSMGDLGLEVLGMSVPSSVGLAKRGISGVRNLFPHSEDKAAYLAKVLSETLDSPSVLSEAMDVGPRLGADSAIIGRQNELIDSVLGARREVGKKVGAAREVLEGLSGETAMFEEMRSAGAKDLFEGRRIKEGRELLKTSDANLGKLKGYNEVSGYDPKNVTFAGTNLADDEITKKLTTREQLDSLFGEEAIAKTFEANPAKEGLDALQSAKKEFSTLVGDLTEGIGAEKPKKKVVSKAISKLGSYFYKYPKGAEKFAEAFKDNPRAVSIAKSAIYEKILKSPTGKYTERLNSFRPALKKLGVKEEQFSQLEDALAKGADATGGSVGFVSNLAGNSLAMLATSYYSYGATLPLHIGAKLLSKRFKDSPALVKELMLKAIDDKDLFAKLVAKATPLNQKRAIEYLEQMGKNLTMGLSEREWEDENIDMDTGFIPEKKSEEIGRLGKPMGDVDLEPKKDDDIINKIIATESNFNPKARSPKGAEGLMQLMPETGREWHKKLGLSGEYNPYNEAQNKQIGTAYFNWLLGQFDGDTKLALAAYNYGIGNVQRKLRARGGSSFEDIKDIVPEETRNYVSKITKA